MSEPIKKPIKRGLNFSLLLDQLTTDYKKQVLEGTQKLSSTFNISPSSEKYLKDLIRKDIKIISIPETLDIPKDLEQKWFQKILSKLSK